MNFLELLLSQCLKDKNPLLDLQGADRRVLQIASEDLLNFLKVHWGLACQENGGYDLVEKVHKYFEDNPEEFSEFVSIWAGLWIKKWNERVKLLIGKEGSSQWSRINTRLKTAESLWRQIKKREEAKDIIVESLIKNGEICGTTIMAENLLKLEIGVIESRNCWKDEKEKLVNLINTTLKKARQLSCSKGPLIFVKIDKKYFALH
ncbi:hypothetical protein E3J51_02485 [Candidatus Bathyarchaeota archaeon]|nr:MAG: hypothetical protein E3J51_02485 [Candidatus Bathyarchaeota archaeon]